MSESFEQKGIFLASAWKASAGYLGVLSMKGRYIPDLLHVGYWKTASMPALIEILLAEAKHLSPISPIDARNALAVPDRAFVTQHLLIDQRINGVEFENVVEQAAVQFTQLTNWGEASAAKVLADHEGISVRTFHTRLRLARERKLINKPGSGERLNTEFDKSFKRSL